MTQSRARRSKPGVRSDDEIRQIMLEYFYERNNKATSIQGKKTGSAVLISVLRADLKKSHQLSAQEVVRNLTYLISQGWVEVLPSSSSFATGRGSIVPSVTNYYIITAAGIDKMQGPSEFTRERFSGIKIEATGQNVITLGDGNQVSVQYTDLGEALSDLKEAIKESDDIDEGTKLDLVVDIGAIEDQLLKPNPNRSVISGLWQGVKDVAIAAGLASSIASVAPLIAPLLVSG